jgi:hypothetical protein
MTKISELLPRDPDARRWRRNPGATALAVTGLLLLQGCATNAPSCDGHFEPINPAALVQQSTLEEGAANEREHTL